MRLLYLAASWVGGLLLGSLIAPSFWLLLPLLAALAALALLRLYQKRPLAPALLAMAFLLALLRSGASDVPPAVVPAYGGETARVEGVVESYPENRGAFTQFVIRIESIDPDQGWGDAPARAMVSARPGDVLALNRAGPRFRYGDRLILEGDLSRPPVFEGFDYRDYLANRGIHLVMAYPKVELVGQGEGNPALARVYDLRFKMSRALSESLAEPQAALAQALLLGERSSLPADLKDDFRNTGASHLLAISGLHVGVLLVLSMGAAAMLLGRKGQRYLAVPLLLIWGYALLSGLSPSVLRAAVMGSVYLAAVAVGRPRSVLPALALAAAIMAGIAPSMLKSVSFQLSFTAVAGIAVLAPPLNDWTLKRLGGAEGDDGPLRRLARWAALAVVVSAAATIATLPLVAFNFQQIPTLGIPATVLALPALPFILATALLTAAAAFIHPSAGEVFGWMAWVPISYLKAVVQLFALVPGSVFVIPGFSGLLVWLYYGGLGLLILAPRSFGTVAGGIGPGRMGWIGQGFRAANPRLLTPALALSLFAAVAWGHSLGGHDGRLHVLFLDVGQGDSVFIVTPQNRRILVDGGPNPLTVARALDHHLPFWNRTLHLVVATHPDEDHLRGLIEVVKRHRVGAVAEGVSENSALYREWREALAGESLEPRFLRGGHTIGLGEAVALEALHPPPGIAGDAAIDGGTNNLSVVLRLAYGEVSFLLTGDIEEEAEIALTRERDDLAATVLKVPHHGSRSSTTPDFLEAVGPVVAVIQAGADNRYGHPHVEVVERLEEAVGGEGLYSAARHGTVELITDGRSLWAKTER